MERQLCRDPTGSCQRSRWCATVGETVPLRFLVFSNLRSLCRVSFPETAAPPLLKPAGNRALLPLPEPWFWAICRNPAKVTHPVSVRGRDTPPHPVHHPPHPGVVGVLPRRLGPSGPLAARSLPSAPALWISYPHLPPWEEADRQTVSPGEEQVLPRCLTG